MARLNRKDRGLIAHANASGGEVWYVRLSHGGRMRKFGSFLTKNEARNFYDQAKRDQRIGKFFPEEYQRNYSLPLSALITDYMSSNHKKSRHEDLRYADWWTERYGSLRLPEVTVTTLKEARRTIEDKGRSPQTVLHYLKFLRHLLKRSAKGRLAAAVPVRAIHHAEGEGRPYPLPLRRRRKEVAEGARLLWPHDAALRADRPETVRTAEAPMEARRSRKRIDQA